MAESPVTTLRYTLQGTIALLAISINTIVLTLVLLVFAVPKLMSPPGAFRDAVNRWLSWLGELWISVNKTVLWFYRGMKWDIRLPEGLDRRGRYLLLCNHQSWVDIMVLQQALNRKAPFMRFMLKQVLIWVPFLGWAWWALDMPFLRRYSRQELLKNPELRGKDLENAARACEKLRQIPVTMVAYPEGTRFSQEKHDQQDSPYRYLLRPRHGGIGQVLYSFEHELKTVIDATIYYPQGAPTFWEFVSGRVNAIVVEARLQPIPAELLGKNFRQDAPSKNLLVNWMAGFWKDKDKQLAAMHDAGGARPQ